MSAVFDASALPFPVEADLIMPGSKSHANRAIICACLASGTTVIRNATPCDDVLVMVENLQKMGFEIVWVNKETGELKIVGTPTPNPSPAHSTGSGQAGRGELDCHNAGTALRFLTSVAALVPGEWTLTGDEHMRKRPIGDLVSALRSLGVEISDTGGCPPIRVVGGKLRGSMVRLKADISSQYLTSLLLIAPLLPQGLTIELDGPLASESYIDLTEKVMKDFGVKIEREMNTFVVRKGEYSSPNDPHSVLRDTSLRCGEERNVRNQRSMSHPSPAEGEGLGVRTERGDECCYDIEGDWSAAGAWLVLNELTRSHIRFPNLHSDSTQADRKLPEMIRRLRRSGDLTIDCSAIPDQVMNLAVLAAFRSGKTTIIGVANLRHKECDRLAVITTELSKVGVNIVEHHDGLIIHGGTRTPHPSPQTLDPSHDHRMAMCFAILGLKLGNISISSPECVKKSYPQFFGHLQSILFSSRPIVIVGMRGAGKSSLGRRLAARLKLRCTDSDHVFVDLYGPIKEYIAAHGWQEFRTKEEELIAGLLHSGTVLSLGGGATESKKTRTLLKERAIVIWIQTAKAQLIKRLESGKRPALTELPLHEEVHKLLVERAPNYKEVTQIAIDPKIPYSKQVPFSVRALRALVHVDPQ